MRIALSIFLVVALCGAGRMAFSQHAPSKSSSIKERQNEALSLFLSDPRRSIKIADSTISITNDPTLLATGFYILSKAYWVKANYRLSTEYGFKALKIVENTRDTALWISSLLSVARTLGDVGNLSRAHDYIHFATRLSRSMQDPQYAAEAVREHSFLHLMLKQYDSALYYSDLGIEAYKKMGDTLGMSILYGRKAKVYFELKDYSKSRKFTYNAMLLDTLVNNRRALAISYYYAAKNEHALNHDHYAIALLNNSIRLNKEIGNLNSLVQALDFLAEVYSKQGKTDLAFRELKLASSYKDSLYNREKDGQIEEMQALYELEGKENTIQSLEREKESTQQEAKIQRWLTFFLLIGITLLFMLILVLWRLRRNQEKANITLEAKNRDIELQKKEIQEQAESLQQLNQLKTKLFSVISHDLRVPLANLQALLELITNSQMTVDEFNTILDKLKLHLNASQGTLENLLNWALSQMEGIRTDQRPVPIKSLIDEACRLMSEVAERKQISIELFGVEPLHVQADPNHIQLVLRNLLHNAIKFSNEKDRVLVSATRNAGHCTVTVKDFGIGMNQAEVDLITGSASHFTKRGTNQEKGTGLGLMLCKEFILRNAGTFTIQSKPGDGTSVTFTLALAEN